MKINSKKTKILIAAACVLIVAAVILIIVIINTKNSDDKDKKGETTVSTGDISPTPGSTNNTEPTASGNQSVTEDPEKTTATPDATATPEPVINTISVTLGEYKGIKVECKPAVITEEKIQELLDSLQKENTEIVDMPDRPFESGDMAIVSYEGKVDGKRIESLYVVCLQVILGNHNLPEAIESEIIGRKKGDSFEKDVEFPETFTAIPEIAGKTVHFEIELEDGFEFDVPEINDAFIKSVTDYSTLEEYKKQTLQSLQEEENQKTYDAAVVALKQKVVDNCKFEGNINDEIKKEYVRRINEENKVYQEDYWMDAAQFYELVYGITAEEYQANIMNEASLKVKLDYVLEEIAKKENITKEEAEQLIIDSAVFEGKE